MTQPAPSQQPSADAPSVADRNDEQTDRLDPATSRGTDAEEPSRAPSDGKLAPGAATDDPVAALWGSNLVERYRGEWRELQLRFVDDPHTATDRAAHLVDDAVQALTNRLTAQKQALDGWQSVDGDDTEVLRVALRRYRDFLDRLLGL
jgi:hypothetical protein